MRIMHTSDRIAHAVLAALNARKSFSQTIDMLDEEVREDLMLELVEIVSDILFEEETN